MEDDDVVETVQEFGIEGALHLFLHLFRDLRELRLGRHLVEAERRVLGDVAGAHVRRHDDDGVLEVDHPAIVVGEVALIQHLQQDVEHIRMRLLDFVEQHHAVGLAANRLGQRPRILVAHIARRRADQARHREFLHVLAHVDPD